MAEKKHGRGIKGSILIAPRKLPKFSKVPSIKSTIQRGSAIVRGFKTRIIAELEAATTKSDPGLTDIKVPPFQQLGVKLLMDGYPKAFIEFFELTHQPQPPPASPDYVDPKAASDAKQLVDASTLIPLKSHMENAEIGAREDDYDKMFAANIGIADLFELVKDYKQALFYFSRALQAGEKTATPTHIAKARFALGRVYWKLNDSALAIQNYEHFIKLAQMADDVASTSEAAQHLLQIHTACAEKFKEDGEYKACRDCYDSALETAVLAENWEMAGEMRYQLGLLYIDARDTDTALGYLTEFHQYCVATNNKIGQGKANEAMSEIFEMLDRASDAVAHMEKYLEVVGSVGLLTKAKAACKIGMLYYRVGDLEAAERSFQSYYAMARQAKDVRTLASARVNLGVVRAALNRPPAVLMDEDQPTYSRPVLVDEGPDNDSDSDDFFK
ncbi:uncharacterized protein [Physcomitrium patens]|nr:uncharacterized protein LOC112291060 isoform X1 [Physcomitrium patens]XP_024393794.1 uncharacterized protein LOC112291060 isoform X1 [Physcomitrium patens]|eukprot:XP_024393785.1 uncharacterized protein LOC112291060 isoform X1 [Physcomitrella patens]